MISTTAASTLASASLSRRATLAALTSAGAGALTIPAVIRAAPSRHRDDQAAAAADTKPDLNGAGFYRFKLGAYTLTLISDGLFAFNPPFPLFGANAGQDAVESALRAEFIEPESTFSHVNVLLIDTGSSKVLVDAGCGTLFGPTTGGALARLARAGVTPEQIDAVILTHAHGDHFGGLTTADGSRTFPDASVFITKTEHAFWTGPDPDLSRSGCDPDTAKAFISGAAKVLAALKDHATLLAPGVEKIDGGISLLPAPGHTPGHVMVNIESGGQRLVYLADLTHHHVLSFRRPDFHMGFDTDLAAAAQARAKTLDMLAADRVLVSGSHLPFPGVGHVAREGAGAFRFVPAPWRW